jgi:type II secretory ATPase GspE/PulE/Tfp pilus assembly ATPase PilB-like protein
MELDSVLRDMIFRNEPTGAVRSQAERTGRLSTLREDGLRKILSGLTTISEVLQVVASLELTA